MSSAVVASPENLQLQSSLLHLPGEIKNIIYDHCFTADRPIVDPAVTSSKSDHQSVPILGIALLQTCRFVYHEADRRSLFARNTFRFTSVDRVRSFVNTLRPAHSALISDIEIDARKVHSDHPGISREWLHYLSWGDSMWAKTLGSLRVDAPGLRCLRDLLRGLILNVEGLERIVVIGTSKGAAMARREPWSSVHFFGGDDVGSDDLVQRMWATLRESDDLKKVIRWHRSDGKMHLEVVSKAYLIKHVDRNWTEPPMRKKHTDPWPENGVCSWLAYQNHK
ncbi:hypothetical protein K469DRAFT_735672 [Zopfia rhizophila CBS 207.26]|uniref:Uncharacterized protein n=1 Tax=Zopfia rhizophila CBS 207.26 TaxID=1314779 RepID=A0A6A6EQ19_9PEZI|nr:hypothetical protein K469DRAFT_735672 [Zopfia rhizophila CBS 207.26]